jgi:hypothetical protein
MIEFLAPDGKQRSIDTTINRKQKKENILVTEKQVTTTARGYTASAQEPTNGTKFLLLEKTKKKGKPLTKKISWGDRNKCKRGVYKCCWFFYTCIREENRIGDIIIFV